jgi:hypothetical protein
MNSKNSISAAKRNPNVLHSILSQQRPIAPKNGSPTIKKGTNGLMKLITFVFPSPF